ncbi:nicotinate-nucleotide diphosphorylase (carboxylating) [Candidatus Poribacteria bacterium]|nr:MAG: nicotinate-nucleotide diphosphorylase (carboxylating) [Candidatus Poribacteria bacterium]
MLNFRSIDPLIELAFEEDIGIGDITTESTVSPSQRGLGTILTETEGVIAGLPIVQRVFEKLDSDLDFQMLVADGDCVESMTSIATVEGSAKSILTGERIALNFLQRLSGTATLTAQFVAATVKYDVKIIDTRKTTAGWRALQKYAVRAGGGHNHRFGLYDGVLIKDNHIVAAGGVAKAIERARSAVPQTLKIEIEVETLDQVAEAQAARADIILLDNMPVSLMKAAVGEIDENILTEASGGITLDQVEAVAATGVNLISVGALTHSAMPLNIRLDLDIK